MKFKEFTKGFILDFYLGIKSGVSRFLVTFICSVLFFLTAGFEIIFETGSEEIIFPLCMAYALTAIFSILLKTTQEQFFGKLFHIIQYALCLVVAVASFFLIKFNFESLYMIMTYTGVIIAFLCFIFFILMRGENRDLAFPRLVSSFIFAFAICVVLSAGISVCIAAVQLLLISHNNFYKAYLIANLLIWTVGYINIFLSFMPKKDVPAPQSKIFRAFVLFAGLPLYTLLIVILLLYLAKIVITWNMPVGEINWFASFASLFFIFFLLSVKQYSEKFARLFSKYGGYFLIPVLIMQAIAVFERINAYGLTTPRTVSLVLIVISVLFIAGSIIAPKHLNKVALISGIIVLVVTCTPFNVIDMPVASQTKILTDVLVANDMLKDGVVVQNENISDEDTEKFISAYRYLKYNAEKLPDIVSDEQSIEKVFDIGFYDEVHNTKYCSYHTFDSIDISDYDHLLKVYQDDNYKLLFSHNGRDYEIDLTELSKELYDKFRTEHQEIDIYRIDDNVALYFENFYFSIDDDDRTVYHCDLNGYALLKN